MAFRQAVNAVSRAMVVSTMLSSVPVAGALDAQGILLRVRPAVGDTLHMQMDQRFEMYGNGVGGSKDKPMEASVRVCTRSVVLGRDDLGTNLLAMTDEVRIEPRVALMIPLFADLKRTLQSRTVRLRMKPDGGIDVLRDKDDPDNSAAFAMAMPALLPTNKVKVGDTWTRDIQIPVSASAAKKKKTGRLVKPSTAMGRVKATFRFDSLSKDRMVAFVSVSGAFSNMHTHPSDSTWSDSTSGKVTGTLRLDRQRAWITDSRMKVTLTSFVRRANSTSRDTSKGDPMQLHMKVMQRLRAMPRGSGKP